jgi:energy-coupling factor transporter ATP-binding protein EcfA2
MHDFIQSLPLGYGTPVGERGVRLSGGQKQRIALARVLLTDPRILILDEPTSSVDADTERRMQQALQEVRAGRTTFVIAHRLWTVQQADQILVLRDGRSSSGRAPRRSGRPTRRCWRPGASMARCTHSNSRPDAGGRSRRWRQANPPWRKEGRDDIRGGFMTRMQGQEERFRFSQMDRQALAMLWGYLRGYKGRLALAWWRR